MRALWVVDAGSVDYRVAFEWQRKLHTLRVADEIPDVLLLLEHPHVYSLGRRFSPEHLLLSDAQLAEKGIDLVESDRGGSITYHGPGQLVAYPILDLRHPKREYPDAIKYLRLLEEALIKTIRSFGVAAARREGLTGVWVGTDKIASIGVNVTRGVSKHGLALNVSPQLEYFEGMIACGLEDAGSTSLEKILQRPIGVGEVIDKLARSLAKVMHRRPVPQPLEQLIELAGLAGPDGTLSKQASIVAFPGHRAGSAERDPEVSPTKMEI